MTSLVAKSCHQRKNDARHFFNQQEDLQNAFLPPFLFDDFVVFVEIFFSAVTLFTFTFFHYFYQFSLLLPSGGYSQ